MQIDVELSDDDLSWLAGYLKGRTSRIKAGLDSMTNADKILGRILRAVKPNAWGAAPHEPIMVKSKLNEAIAPMTVEQVENVEVSGSYSFIWTWPGIHYLCSWTDQDGNPQKTWMHESEVVIQTKKDVEDDIKVGDIVTLSGYGAPLMRVSQRAQDYPYKGIHYLCTWFGPENKEHKVWFHQNTLAVHKI